MNLRILQYVSNLAITRVVNACVLLELGDDAVLTDPYFDNHWFMRLREPIGLAVEALPRLTAILGGHGVFDHWQPSSLAGYPYKAETPVLVATRSMMRRARAAGFQRVEVLPWNTTHALSPSLGLEVIGGQRSAGMKVNSYVLTTDRVRVFVGTEARDLESLREYRTHGSCTDVALLPIDGSSIVGHKLVMTAADAIEGARILGARTLVPIHYALEAVPFLLQTRSSLPQLMQLAHATGDVEIVPLEPGQRWCWVP